MQRRQRQRAPKARPLGTLRTPSPPTMACKIPGRRTQMKLLRPLGRPEQTYAAHVRWPGPGPSMRPTPGPSRTPRGFGGIAQRHGRAPGRTRISDKGGLRVSSSSHVIDVAADRPRGAPASLAPEIRRRHPAARPSTARASSTPSTSANAKAPTRHTTQYFEMVGRACASTTTAG
jgi:hypothetical protein